jgi:hypothetical protein
VQVAVGYVIRDVHMLQAGSSGVHEGQQNKRAAGVWAAVGSTGCGGEHGLQQGTDATAAHDRGAAGHTSSAEEQQGLGA